MHVPVVERTAAECVGIARVFCTTYPRAVAGSARYRHAAQLSQVGHSDGGAANDGFGAELLRCRRKRQFPRRKRTQGLQPDRADCDDCGDLRPAAQGQGDCAARSLAYARWEFPVDAERGKALRDGHSNFGYCTDSSCRPRIKRLHLRSPRHRRNPLRHPLRNYRRHWRAEGPAARRRQRRRDAAAA